MKRNLDGKKRRKGKKRVSNSTSTSRTTAPSEDSRQSGCDHDLHKGEDAYRPTQSKAVALEAERKEESSKDASGKKGRVHKTAATGKSLFGVDQPSAVPEASTGSPGGGGDGKKSKKSRKRRRHRHQGFLCLLRGQR